MRNISIDHGVNKPTKKTGGPHRVHPDVWITFVCIVTPKKDRTVMYHYFNGILLFHLFGDEGDDYTYTQ